MSVSHRSKDLVVVSALKDWTCAACESTDGGWLVMEDRGPLCMSCADLAHLVGHLHLVLDQRRVAQATAELQTARVH